MNKDFDVRDLINGHLKASETTSLVDQGLCTGCKETLSEGSYYVYSGEISRMVLLCGKCFRQWQRDKWGR